MRQRILDELRRFKRRNVTNQFIEINLEKDCVGFRKRQFMAWARSVNEKAILALCPEIEPRGELWVWCGSRKDGSVFQPRSVWVHVKKNRLVLNNEGNFEEEDWYDFEEWKLPGQNQREEQERPEIHPS